MFKSLSLLFLAAFASGQMTQQICEEGVTCIGDLITDAENIEYQVQFVTDELCSDPALDPCDADKCRLHLPELWRAIAEYMWPLAFSDEAQAWWCSGVGISTVRSQETCDDCVAGLQYIRDVMLHEDTIDFVVNHLQGPDFCGQAGGSGKGKGKGGKGKGKGSEGKGKGKGKGKGRRGMRAVQKNQYLVNRGEEEWGPEICAEVIAYVIPRAFATLAGASIEHDETVCNHCLAAAPCPDYYTTGTGGTGGTTG